MKRIAVCIAMLATAAASASAQESVERQRHSYANPTALIAAEIALGQLAVKEGQWTAFRDTAADGAQLLVPERVSAQDWLKSRNDPATPAQWTPFAAWISCDGSFGVVEGGLTAKGESSRFASVWQRQQKGGYKWLIRQRIGIPGPAAEPDMLSATVADCDARQRPKGDGSPPETGRSRQQKPPEAPPLANAQSDWSSDRTLYWQSGEDASGTPWLLVKIRKDGAMRTVLGKALDQANQTAPEGS